MVCEPDRCEIAVGYTREIAGVSSTNITKSLFYSYHDYFVTVNSAIFDRSIIGVYFVGSSL